MRQLAWELVTQSAVSEQQAFMLSRNAKAFCKHQTQLWMLPGFFAQVLEGEGNVTRCGGTPTLQMTELKL